MTHKVYVVTDLGPGDGGKGGVVHKITDMMRAHTVIKRGGAQGSHGVRTSSGESFAFSQWGCGTLAGIPTHLSGQMIISPEGLLNEAEALRHQCGIYAPFDLLTVDETSLCATPFDGIASRVKELALGTESRGTVGTGVGQAYRRFRDNPTAAIRAKDLKGSNLRELLRGNRELVQAELQYIIEYDYLEADRATLAEEVRMLYDDRFLDYLVERFTLAGEQANIVSSSYLGEVILAREGAAVVEASHGVLTDNRVGFAPHTSAIRTLPCFTHEMLRSSGFDGQIVNLGVTRAYAVRHGAGPLPTANPALAESLLPGSNKDENRWQGKVRVGPLDVTLLRYALAACGGVETFDGIAVTWFDQVRANGIWHISERYKGPLSPEYFSPSGEIKLADNPSREHQQALTQQVSARQPSIKTIEIDLTFSNDDLYDLCASVFDEMVGASVRMVSFGPTEIDKLCK
jgi:adenylosuccinate synthase